MQVVLEDCRVCTVGLGRDQSALDRGLGWCDSLTDLLVPHPL